MSKLQALYRLQEFNYQDPYIYHNGEPVAYIEFDGDSWFINPLDKSNSKHFLQLAEEIKTALPEHPLIFAKYNQYFWLEVSQIAALSLLGSTNE